MLVYLWGSFAFQHRYGNFTILKDLFQMDEGYVAKQRGRGLPVGGGVSLMTHSAGSVTTQGKAFNYVMASEPYRYT